MVSVSLKYLQCQEAMQMAYFLPVLLLTLPLYTPGAAFNKLDSISATLASLHICEAYARTQFQVEEKEKVTQNKKSQDKMRYWLLCPSAKILHCKNTKLILVEPVGTKMSAKMSATSHQM